MIVNNMKIRVALLSHGLTAKQVAEHMGVTRFTFSRWLREELSNSKSEMILSTIKAVAKEVE